VEGISLISPTQDLSLKAPRTISRRGRSLEAGRPGCQELRGEGTKAMPSLRGSWSLAPPGMGRGAASRLGYR